MVRGGSSAGLSPFARMKGAEIIAAGAMGFVCLLVLSGMSLSGDRAWFYHPATDPLWRGMLAQIIHLNDVHMLANLLLLLALWGIAQLYLRTVLLLPALLFCALMVSLGLHFEYAPLIWYVGLSGALYGAWAWLLLEYAGDVRQGSRRILAYGILCALVAKVLLAVSPAFLTIPVAHSAHLYGLSSGIVFALVVSACRRYRRLRSPA